MTHDPVEHGAAVCLAGCADRVGLSFQFLGETHWSVVEGKLADAAPETAHFRVPQKAAQGEEASSGAGRFAGRVRSLSLRAPGEAHGVAAACAAQVRRSEAGQREAEGHPPGRVLKPRLRGASAKVPPNPVEILIPAPDLRILAGRLKSWG